MSSFVIMAAVLAAGPSSDERGFVYVSLGGEQRIAIFALNPETGELAHVADADVVVEGTPGAQCASPDRRFLFLALRSTQQLASFEIDAPSGRLKPLGLAAGGANAAYVATDRAGRYLLSASYASGLVAVHAIAADGTLSKQPLQTIETARNAHCIQPDPKNRFVFVPHTGPNAVFQFRFEAQTGTLSPNQPPQVEAPQGSEPRHLVFHPRLPLVYCVNERGSSVTAYAFDEQTGTLTPGRTVSTLPKGFAGSNSCAEIALTPDVRFLYASNRGHDSLAGFAVDEKTGELTPLGQFTTEKTPRSFGIDPGGRFVYAAGQGSGKLAAYRVDPQSGALERFATYALGKEPAWVQVLQPSLQDQQAQPR